MRSLPRLLLALSCCLPAPSLWAVDDLTRLLEVMGLQDVFVELQPLAEAQLEQAGAALDAPAAAALREALAPGRMQAALERTLRIDVAPGLSREALETLDSESLRPLVDSCHGGGRRDLRIELEAYEARLAEQPPVESRVMLVQQLDGASRSSRIAALAQGGMERLVLAHIAPAGTAIPWQQVEQARLTALQRGARDWYLFCGRYYPDALLARLVDRYSRAAVQQVLDHYESALQRSFEALAPTAP